MSVTAAEYRATEELLTRYFKDMKKLRIWTASANNRREHVKRLESRIETGISVRFSDNVQSARLNHAQPSNRQPPKGLDAAIDKAAAVFDNLVVEKGIAELDVITTEEEIAKLERELLMMSEIIKLLDKETVRVIEMKLLENKSFEDIGDIVRKSKSAVHEFYKKAIIDISEWLKYFNLLSV